MRGKKILALGMVLALLVGTMSVGASALGSDSEITPITQSDGTTCILDRKNNIITGVAPNMTVDQLEAKLTVSTGTIKIYNKDGTEITGTTLVGTGCAVKHIANDNIAVLEQFTTVVFGDVNGDGIITIDDVSIIESYYENSSKIPYIPENYCYLYAMDLNHTGQVSYGNDLEWDKTLITKALSDVTAINQYMTVNPLEMIMPVYRDDEKSCIINRESLISTITGIVPDTTVDQLKAELTSSAGTIKIYQKDGKTEMTGSEIVGTGCIAELYDGTSEISGGWIVIFGDVNGDGKIDSEDYNTITSFNAGTFEFDNIYNYLFNICAMETDGDAYINSTDASLISDYIAGKTAIDQYRTVPKKYKTIIADGKSCKVDRNHKIITGVTPGTAVNKLKSNLDSTYTMKFYSKYGTEITGDAIVGTGTVVKLMSDYNEVLDQYKIVIFGDVDGNGKITAGESSDESIIQSYCSNSSTISYESKNYYCLYAMDVDHNGKIDENDAALISKEASGTTSIDQCKIVDNTFEMIMPEAQDDGHACILDRKHNIITGLDINVGTDLFKTLHTNVGQLKAKLTSQAGIIKVLDKNSKELANDANVGTGCIVELIGSDNKLIESFTVVVFGDLDGDGKVAAGTDGIRLLGYINKPKDNCYKYAADINNDGTINNADNNFDSKFISNAQYQTVKFN